MQVLPALFARGDMDIPEPEVVAALHKKLGDHLAPMALYFLLIGVANHDPGRMRAVLDSVIEEAQRRGIDPVPLAAGVGRVFRLSNEPVRSIGADLIRGLASRPPFDTDERMRELMVALGSR
jgi:hypothetical protein